MLAIVTLVGQVLVLEARLRARRVANVLTRPMGMTTRREFGASLIEIGGPLLTGVAAGGLIGWGVASLALGRLDALRLRQPPAVLVVDATTLALAGALVVVVALVVAAVATARTVRRDPAEVMRVAES
jgi:ABC-type antimicrobial peptide transport system permease subunit